MNITLLFKGGFMERQNPSLRIVESLCSILETVSAKVHQEFRGSWMKSGSSKVIRVILILLPHGFKKTSVGALISENN